MFAQSAERNIIGFINKVGVEIENANAFSYECTPAVQSRIDIIADQIFDELLNNTV